jgi:hypothetical protein
MFQFALRIAEEKGLLEGRTVAVDSTTLEANAAMKSIERKDTGEDWKEYLRRLAAAEGIENPTDEELRRFDKQRKNKKVSNEEWQSSTDPDSRIARMKDGTTHLAYKAEHVVDLETDIVLAATVYTADRGDTETLAESVVQAQKNVIKADSEANIEEVAADKGYHSAETVETVSEALQAVEKRGLARSGTSNPRRNNVSRRACPPFSTRCLGVRTYIPEPERKHRLKWKDKPAGRQAAVYANRRRTKGNHGKRLQKQRSEFTERSFAHVCETGGARRCWLRGLVKVSKRYLIQVAARNLGVILRKLFGMGTARGLQGKGGLASLLYIVILAFWTVSEDCYIALCDFRKVQRRATRIPTAYAAAA